jgi:hypothetical protein
MLGWINQSIEAFITQTFGAEKWLEVIARAEVNPNWVSTQQGHHHCCTVTAHDSPPGVDSRVASHVRFPTFDCRCPTALTVTRSPMSALLLLAGCSPNSSLQEHQL